MGDSYEPEEYHVIPDDIDWDVKVTGVDDFSTNGADMRAETEEDKQDAIETARTQAKNKDAILVIHDRDGNEVNREDYT